MSAQPGERKDKLKHIDITSIIVSDRARENMGDLNELEESIREKGVIQPITLDSGLRLLAGGRRLLAATNVGLKQIPCIIREFIDEMDSKEIELMENTYRKDFSWQEQAKLVSRIHDLYQAKHPDGSWNMRKTAELLDKSLGGVSNAVTMAAYLEVVPEMGQLKTADDARKFVKRMGEDIAIAEMRKRQEAMVADTKANDPDLSGIQLALKAADRDYRIGDCFVGMKEMKTGGHIHFIECDPPYGIDLNNQKASSDSVGSTVQGYKEVQEDMYPSFLSELAKETYRIAYRDSWMIFWFGPTWQHEVLTALKDAGWAVDEIPAVWTKFSGQTLQPQVHLARGYEPFFICRKGQPVLATPGRLNVFNFAGVTAVGADRKYHPTQRPVDLIESILKCFIIGQQACFVPFLGSGATLRACYNRGIPAFGYDLDGKYKDQFMLAVEKDSRALLANDKD